MKCLGYEGSTFSRIAFVEPALRPESHQTYVLTDCPTSLRSEYATTYMGCYSVICATRSGCSPILLLLCTTPSCSAVC